MSIQEYPDYYRVIREPIAMSTLRKRATSNYYKSVAQYREDWKLMFKNAFTYNQEGSWVYVDAEEMERVFDATYDRVMIGSGLPGAPAGDVAMTPMDEDDRPAPSRRGSGGRKQVISDDEYLTPSDEE